jgi:hypothetical protein
MLFNLNKLRQYLQKSILNYFSLLFSVSFHYSYLLKAHKRQKLQKRTSTSLNLNLRNTFVDSQKQQTNQGDKYTLTKHRHPNIIYFSQKEQKRRVYIHVYV